MQSGTKTRRPLGALLLCLFLAIPAALLPAASPSPNVTGDLTRQDSLSLSFSTKDRMIVQQYFRTSRGGSSPSPGISRKKHLPSSLEKHLAKNGTLPSGLAKRALPIDLENRLTAIPVGYERWIIGADVVLINSKTRVIVDVVAGPAR